MKMTETGTATIPSIRDLMDAKYQRRVVSDLIIRIIGYIVLGFMIGVLLLIVGYVAIRGLGVISLKMLTTVGNTSTGGLLNAIVGTWELVGTGLLLALPVGVFGALYLSEYSTRNTGGALRLFVDVLTSIPSIVLGLFGYLVLVIQLNLGYSLLAGGLTLGVMMIPYIMRISEISFSNVPKETREAAFALGANTMQVSFRLLLVQASVGIMTAILLAVSIAAGETAQLLYTSLFNNDLTTRFVHEPVAYLTYVVWYSINQPTSYAHQLAYAAALVLVASIFSLLLLSKYISRGKGTE